MLHTFARRGLVATAAALLTAPLFTGSAAADTGSFKDARGDLDHGADIWSVRVVNDDQVRVKVRHDDLVRSFRSGSSVVVFMDTDRGRKGPEFVFLGGTFEGADYALLPARGWRRASDQQVPLRGGSYDMRLDYARDTALIRIDRQVLRNPSAVRVAVKTGGEMVPTGTEPAATGVDWLGGRRHLTPWVPRG